MKQIIEYIIMLLVRFLLFSSFSKLLLLTAFATLNCASGVRLRAQTTTAVAIGTEVRVPHLVVQPSPDAEDPS